MKANRTTVIVDKSIFSMKSSPLSQEFQAIMDPIETIKISPNSPKDLIIPFMSLLKPSTFDYYSPISSTPSTPNEWVECLHKRKSNE